jgi:hypothetical protein
MKTLLKHSLTAFVLLAGLQSSRAQNVLLSPSASQVVNQPVASGARSTLGVNSFNNTYYVNQWCSTSGTLDDTCFSNAIADVVTHAVTGYSGRRMQILRVSPGVYTFNHTVVVPLGINISITGEYQAGVWGSVISSGSTPVDFFHVEADNIEIHCCPVKSRIGSTG